MEWDKNTKIIVAVLVVVVVIAAGAGIAFAMNNNNDSGGGEKQPYAKTGSISVHTDTGYDVPAFIKDQNGKKVNLVLSNNIPLPEKSTTIGSDEKGWQWDSENGYYVHGGHYLKVTVTNAKIVKGTGDTLYNITYDKGAVVDITVDYKSIS